VILWELLTADQPFKNLAPSQVAVMIAEGTLALPMPKYLPQPVLDLLRSMTTKDPAIRPSFAGVMQRLEAINFNEFVPDLVELRANRSSTRRAAPRPASAQQSQNTPQSPAGPTMPINIDLEAFKASK